MMCLGVCDKSLHRFASVNLHSKESFLKYLPQLYPLSHHPPRPAPPISSFSYGYFIILCEILPACVWDSLRFFFSLA